MHILNLIAASAPPQQVPQSSVLLYILGAAVAGGGFTALLGLIRYWRRGQVEDTELVSRITKDTVAGAKDILAEYRLEVEIVKRQVEAYRDQLNNLTMALAEANVKISNLERQLSTAQTEHTGLQRDLQEAMKERKRLMHEIGRLHVEIKRLLGDDVEEDKGKEATA